MGYYLDIVKTRTGKAAIWEWGGGCMNTGNAQIICSSDWKPLEPIYIKRRGHLANGNHALFPARPGIIVIMASHHRGDFNIGIHQLVELQEIDGEYKAKWKTLFGYKDGEWAKYNDEKGKWEPGEPPPESQKAIKSAIEKAKCYHCREPHCVKPKHKSEVR